MIVVGTLIGISTTHRVIAELEHTYSWRIVSENLCSYFRAKYKQESAD